jgi:SNF2 family DNA or RNA helicase
LPALAAAALAAAAPLESPPEAGDRFEVQHVPGTDCLRVPPLNNWEMAGQVLIGLDGQAVPLTTPDDGLLELPGLSGALTQGWDALWLECLGDNRWRLEIERPSATAKPALAAAAPTPAPGAVTTRAAVPIEFTGDARLLWQMWSGHSATLAEVELALRAARLATHAGFDQLMCLPMVRDMDLLEHQVRTAKTVLRRFRGRALLCDEVGLGKTIEAGLVLAELHLRGLARGVLVLTPPSLIEQWQGEMRRKFGLEFTSHDHPDFREAGAAAWGQFDRVIASFHTAKREPHRSAILERKWDLVIVDEAHHLRNRATLLWKFASEIQKQFILLLTATPVQNNLDELFNLVTLLEPGLLSTAKRFQKQFVDRKDKLTPRNVDELHGLLSEVMVRNRRSTVGLQFTRRWARTERVPQTAAEEELYAAVAALVRQHMRRHLSGAGASSPGGSGPGALSRMALLSLQMALGSSSQAAAGTLARVAEHSSLTPELQAALLTLAERAGALKENAKTSRLLELLSEYPDKMVIFTQFRATQDMLAERLRAAGEPLAVFHGGLSRLEKEKAVEAFRGPARLLLCTEAGSEGRNLQFAHAICNYDLPWNPMKIEQRIGRLSRIGQTHDVHVFNLVAAGTLEAAVLHLLEAKLNLFEMVIGEIDMVLGNLDEEREFQDVVADLWAESDSSDDFAHRMEALGNRLLAAKEAYLEQKRVDDRLFADRFAPDR